MGQNHFPKAMDYLMQLAFPVDKETSSENAFKMLADIGKHRPAVIVESYERLFPLSKVNPLEQTIVDLAKASMSYEGHPHFISCIKLYRDRTNMGLRESKEAVEAIFAKYGIQK
jgi:hypothetical protein